MLSRAVGRSDRENAAAVIRFKESEEPKGLVAEKEDSSDRSISSEQVRM
jgi:hypothetical protein